MNCKPMQRKCLQQLASCSICHRPTVVSSVQLAHHHHLLAHQQVGTIRTNENGRIFSLVVTGVCCVLLSSLLRPAGGCVRAPFFLQLVALYCSRACMHMHMRGVTDWAWRRPRVLLFGHEILPSIGAVSGQIFIARDGMCSPNCSKSQVLIPAEEKKINKLTCSLRYPLVDSISGPSLCLIHIFTNSY